MKSVIMVYPDKRYVDYDPEGGGHPGGLHLSESYWTRAGLGISREEFRRRAGLINTLIDAYRQNDHRVYWAVFSLDGAPTVADTDNIHHTYKVHPEDTIVPVGVSYKQLKHQGTYPDARAVLRKLSLGDHAVFGGLHSNDCVAKFEQAARSLGVPTEIDELLTERWFFTLLESFNCDLDAKLMATGMMVSDDDNPFEQKRWIFHDRLSGEDLRIRYRLLTS